MTFPGKGRSKSRRNFETQDQPGMFVLALLTLLFVVGVEWL